MKTFHRFKRTGLALVAGVVCGAAKLPAARLADAFGANAAGWRLAPSASSSGAWRTTDGRVVANPAQVEAQDDTGREAVASYTVPAGGAGFHAITDSFVRRAAMEPGRIDLRVEVRRANTSAAARQTPAVLNSLEGGELFDFDAFLGYLAEGDVVRVAIGAAGEARGDRTEIDFRITRTPEIPVTVFAEDFDNPQAIDAPGAWSFAHGVSADSAAARHLAWNSQPMGIAGRRIMLDARKGDGALLSFRVPHSGYYAVHDAWFVAHGGRVEAMIHVGRESGARVQVQAQPAGVKASLAADIGYVEKGDVISFAFSNAAATTTEIEIGGSIVEWAPRRAPIRVRRGDDGYLDVYEPEAPRQAVDIPSNRWITVRAQSEDATAVLREAFAAAIARRTDDGYVGVRLERDATYVVASGQVGGAVFPFRDAQRIVFDGNGATLRVASPELSRKEVDLFTLTNSRRVVFADFVVEATSVPFTTGEILDVSPRGENTQTVTFRVDPGELDPLSDISRDGRNNAYAYDPTIPGRLAQGTWTHYPGNGNPSIQATDTPGVFTHRVTRTNDSIEPGGKWLIKNKRAGVVYLTTRSGTEDVTMSGIDGRAPGGGQLRFWQTSGVNILNCRFEPDGDNWISSSADGIHGRGREGVWIEDTLIRGICEDIMNTYGQNMIVIADEAPDDTVMSIRMFTRSSESFDDGAPRIPAFESVEPGDQLMFFNPRTGRVLGYARVVSIANGRYTLSNPVPDLDPWEEGDGKNATMVYNTRAAGRFFVRDTRMMDSMRFGIYIKARGGVVFGSQFEGLSAPAIFATNEPEWPEGPPATHLWIQGCTFSQNNFGYMPRHRDFMVVDPADISVYTRRFRDPAEPDDFRANLTRGQYANSHMKFIGNVFHDWRGMGIAVRNSRNVRIEDNLFLPPINDEAMRRTLAEDPALKVGERGAYAAIFLDSVDGVSVSGNRFHGLGEDGQGLVTDREVSGLRGTVGVASAAGARATVGVSFDEWFGDASVVEGVDGGALGRVQLGGAQHRAGRLGAGVFFAGGAPATLAALPARGVDSATEFSVGLWTYPEGLSEARQSALILGDEQNGIVVAWEAGRWRGGLREEGRTEWIDLGPATPGGWRHLALVIGGNEPALRGYVDGLEVAKKSVSVRALHWTDARALIGGGIDGEAFHGGVDEVRWGAEKWSEADIAAFALRRLPGDGPNSFP